MQSTVFTTREAAPTPTTAEVTFVVSAKTAVPGEARNRVTAPRGVPFHEHVEPCDEGVGIESASYGQAA
jgi:hypothetical protein